MNAEKSTSKKRILYLVGEHPSATETFVAREIEALRDRGVNVSVVPVNSCNWWLGARATLAHAGTVLQSYARICRGERVRPDRRLLIGALLRAGEIHASAGAFDHIHAHFLGLPAVVAHFLGALRRCPYSLTAHAHDIYVVRTPARVIEEACFRSTCTETGRQFLAKTYPHLPFELVRHGIKVESYAHNKSAGRSSCCRILAVARFVEKKGLAYLIRACGLLQDAHFPFRCVIVGDGPLLEKLKKEQTSLRLQNRLFFAGHRGHTEVTDFLGNADVFVAPSVVAANGDRDGVPNAVLEAMVAGVPVVATDAGGLPEVLQDRRTGIVVPQRNECALAEAIKLLWHDQRLTSSLVDAARKTIGSSFCPEMWMDKLCALFGAFPGKSV